MTIFQRPITIPQQQLRFIDDAYKVAGVTRTEQTTAVQAAIADAPTVEQVSAAIARDSLKAADAEQFVEDSLDAIQRAHAADALRAAYSNYIGQATIDDMPRILENAAKELAPAFNKMADAFTKAAKVLDPNEPLDVETALERSAVEELKTARAVLAKLGVFAGMYQQGMPQNVPPTLMSLLPLLNLPPCSVEQVRRTPAIPAPVLNTGQLKGTYAVRELTSDAERDMDKTLVGIAAGRYEGVTFALGSPEDNRARTLAARTAYERKAIEPDIADMARVMR